MGSPFCSWVDSQFEKELDRLGEVEGALFFEELTSSQREIAKSRGFSDESMFSVVSSHGYTPGSSAALALSLDWENQNEHSDGIVLSGGFGGSFGGFRFRRSAK